MATYRLKSKLFGPAPGPKPKPKPRNNSKPYSKPQTQRQPNGNNQSVTINLGNGNPNTSTLPQTPATNNSVAQTQAQQTQNVAQEQTSSRFGSGLITGAGLGVAGTVGYGIYKNKKDEERSSEGNSQSLQPYYG